jgi:competence protein ComEA
VKPRTNNIRKDYLLGSGSLIVLIVLVQIGMFMIEKGDRPIPLAEPSLGVAAVELLSDGESQGIFFIGQGVTVSQFLKSQAIDTTTPNSTPIRTGMSIQYGAGKVIAVGEMAAHEKMALGMPLDIHSLSVEELILVPGIGAKTALKIYKFVKSRGCLKDLGELAAIDGIKERRIAQLRPYFTVESEKCRKPIQSSI